MRAFKCIYNFSRKVPLKSLSKSGINQPKISKESAQSFTEDSNQDVMPEMQKLSDEFQGTKTMKLVDKVLDNYFKKGYSMDQIINIIQKGGVISDDIKKAFQSDASKNQLVLEKQKQMEEQLERTKTENPELYKLLHPDYDETVDRSAPKYNHDKKDKKQKQETVQPVNNKTNSNKTTQKKK